MLTVAGCAYVRNMRKICIKQPPITKNTEREMWKGMNVRVYHKKTKRSERQISRPGRKVSGERNMLGHVLNLRMTSGAPGIVRLACLYSTLGSTSLKSEPRYLCRHTRGDNEVNGTGTTKQRKTNVVGGETENLSTMRRCCGE